MNKSNIDKFRHQLYGALDNKVDIQLIQELNHEINRKFNQELHRNLITPLTDLLITKLNANYKNR